MNTHSEVVREARVRRLAKREGLLIQKSRARDARAPSFGCYRIVDPSTGVIVAGGGYFADFEMSLEDIEAEFAGEVAHV